MILGTNTSENELKTRLLNIVKYENCDGYPCNECLIARHFDPCNGISTKVVKDFAIKLYLRLFPNEKEDLMEILL